MIQPKFGAISCAKLLNAESKIRVEGVFKDLEEVKKTISVSANAFLVSREVKGDNVSVKAKVVFTLVYLSEDGYKKAVCDVDGGVELPIDDCTVYVYATDVKVVTTNGYSAVCTLNFKGEGKELMQKNVVCGGDGVCIKEKELFVDIYNKEKRGQQVISDEFALDYTVGEVLSHEARAYVTKANCSMGKVILEGETVLTVKTLPFSENNDIVKERRIIPFRYELEDGDALQGDRAYGNVNVVATNVKVFSDEGRERSSVLAEITLAFCGGSVSQERISVVKDVYSKTNECDIVNTSFKLLTFTEQKCLTEKVVCQGSPYVDGGRILTVLSENLSVISLKQSNGEAVLDGMLKADVVLKNSDNGISSISVECPVSVEFAINGAISSLRLVLTDVIARLRNGEIELECHVKLYYKEYFEVDVDCIEDVIELGQRNNLDGAICVCLGKKGDDLWDIAKKIGADEQEILSFNQDVEFPLALDERIIIYRQKI